MIDKDKKGDSVRKKPEKLIKVYRLISYFVVPLMFLFIVLEKPFDFEINYYHKLLLIYAMSAVILLAVGGTISSHIATNFFQFHNLFLLGIMVISLLWYFQGKVFVDYRGESLILAANLVGISLIKPKYTIGFYIILLFVFTGLSVYKDVFSFHMLMMLIVTTVVISGFNYWRYQIYEELQISRFTYKDIFDASQVQKYVVSQNMEIIDLNKTAAKYLADQQVENYEGKKFKDVFNPGDTTCIEKFKAAIEFSESDGYAFFTADCRVSKSEDLIPVEFIIKKGKYFNKEVFIISVRVVKEQKEFENALIQHKDNVTQILENIDYFVFNITYHLKDKYKHQVNFVSKKVEDVYGYSVDEYINLIKSERIDNDRHPEDTAEINIQFQSLLQSGGSGKWQFRLKVNNEWRWMEEKLFVTKNDSETVSLFGMVKDVTENILSERKLINSERRYRQIFENNLAGVYKTHVNGEVLDCNLAFAHILGYESVEEVKKLRIQDLYYEPTDRKPYILLLKKKKQLNNYISFLRRKDGRRLILNNNVSIIQDDRGEYTIIVGTVIDITELHETSQALLQSEEKYRLLFEESNNAILLVAISDNDCFIIDANQMGEKLFSCDQQELIGAPLKRFLAEAEFSDKIIEFYKGENTQHTQDKELEFVRKNGEVFDAEVSLASIHFDNENVVQLVIKDISERKQYEKEILESRLSFKNIVDRSPASVLIFTEGQLAYVNPKGEELYQHVLLSQSSDLYEVFPKETHVLIKDLIKEAENNSNSYTEIELGEGKEIKRYNINAVSITYNAKKATLFLLMDITLQSEYNIQKLRAEIAEESNVSLQEEIKRHKRTQLSLMESTSRLKALFETAAQLYIISIDRNYQIVSFNQNFKEMIWATLKKKVEKGTNFMELFPIEEGAYEVITERFEYVLNGNPTNLISHFPSKETKKEIWMESFLSPIMLDGQEIKEISFIAHDITEAIENRKKILKSEENNKALLLAVPDILFKVNKEGVFTDYRSTGESGQKAFSRLLKTDKVIGEKIEKVLLDKEVAGSIKEHVLLTLKSEQIITQNLSFDYPFKEDKQRIHYENRYSKINDEEVVIISRNVTDTVEYEERLIESVREKEVLLKEVHHRVKNNLQVINSILNLQSSYVTDEKTLQIIIESQNRIRSMSYIHESLYQTKDFSSINFDDYISNLVQNLVHSYEVYSDKTQLDLSVDKVSLALDQAIPCGLILNELITNALKYAYPGDKGGKITIAVFEEKGKVKIRVKDFGVGLPKDFNIAETESLGLSLVDTLIEQLDGELILKTNKGTEFLIIFEKQQI
ncbi:MAG: PAS domain S-box protein [Crocinitomicaceae bacterium]